MVILSACAGFLIVALGAFGAHGLSDVVSDQGADWWDTATLYGLVHSAVALALAVQAKYRVANYSFLAGVVIFSGTLYAMALGAPRWFGAITPIGGILLLAGWALIAVYTIKR